MELIRALGALAEPPTEATGRIASTLGLPAPRPDEYTDAFLFQLYPYASVYLGSDGMIGGAAGDRIAGFWRALRLTPPAEPDHLSALLGLYAALGDREVAIEKRSAERVLVREARKALLWEHLLSWLPPYLRHMTRLGPHSYSKWATLLLDALALEAQTLGPPVTGPAHFLEVAGMIDPRQGGSEEFLKAILAPGRSGLILARADLARAARDLGVGLRLAERAYTLRSLFGQDREGTLGWLAAEAGRAARPAGRREIRFEPVLRHWKARAAATAMLLRDLIAAAHQERPADSSHRRVPVFGLPAGSPRFQ